MVKLHMSRRRFLKWSGALGAATVLAACNPQPTATPVPPTKAPAQATTAPASATKAPEPTKVPEPTKAPTAKPAAKGPVKITILFRAQEADMKTVDAQNAAFNKKFPDYNVSALYVSSAESEPKLMAMYAAGIPPDIYGTTGTNPYSERYLRGMVLALQPLLDKEGPDLLKDAWPIAVNGFRIAGKVYGLPTCVHAGGTWINATLFDEAGVKYPPVDWKDKSWTWDAMVETAKKLTLDKNKDGKIDQVGVSVDWSQIMWGMTRMWGKDIVGKDAYETAILRKLELDKQDVYDACLAALQARHDLIWKHHVSPQTQESGALSALGPMLLTGVLAMQIQGSWATWGDLPAKYKYRAAAVPWGGIQGNGTTGRWCWLEPYQISAKTPSPEAAWAYAKYITFDPEAIGIGMNFKNTMPLLKSGYDLWAGKYGNRFAMTPEEQKTFWFGAIEQAEYTSPEHILATWVKVRDLTGPELKPGWENQKTMKECLDSFIPRANQQLADYAKEMGL